MDPKGVGGINRLYRDGQIVTLGQHRMAPTAAHREGGMSNEDFFAKYGDELMVLNGLDYSVNNHSPCSRYMATSLNLLANADAIRGVAQHPYHDDFALDRINATLQQQFDARVSQVRLPRVERAQSMLYAAQVNSKALERVTPYVPQESAEQRLAKQADIALATFKAGVCVSANLSTGQFDSHKNNDPDQMRLIPELLAGIDYLMTRAEELQIRDQLVIVVQSEMGRTPSYKDGEGKDHWSIGSIMMMGQGIEGNRVIGATDEKQFLVPIDPQSLATESENGIRVRPEHIHAALRRFAEIDDHAFSEQFPLDVPDQEQLVDFFGTT